MTKHLTQDVFAIHIEGIGPWTSPASGVADGWLWTSTYAPEITTGNYEQRADLIVDAQNPLQSLDTLIEPFKNRQRFSAFDFKLHASDPVAELMMYRQTTAPYELQSELQKSVTTVDLGVTGLDDTVIFVHGETILLGTDSGGGSYTGSTRKYFDSDEEYHATGSAVYTEPPFWAGRRVILYTLKAGQTTLTERWRGRIDGSVNMDRAQIQIRCRELTGGLKDVEIGKSLGLIRNQTFSYTAFADSEQLFPQTINFDMDIQVTKPSASEVSEAVFNTGIQVGDTLMWGIVQNSTYPGTSQSVRTGSVQGGTPFLRSGDNIDSDKEVGDADEGDVREVFFVDRQALFTAANHYSSTYKLANVSYDYADKYPYHPLAIFGALTLSTDSIFCDEDNFDILQGTFSLNAKHLFSPDIVTTLHDEIQANPDLQVDQVLLGWDGDQTEVMDFCLGMLHAFGYYLGIDNNGKLTIQRVRLPDVEDFDNALSNEIKAIQSRVLSLSDGQEGIAQVIQAQLGELPYSDGKSLFVQGIDGAPRRPSELANEPDTNVDFNVLGLNSEATALSMLESRTLLQGRAYPRLRVRVNDWEDLGLDYSLGEAVLMTDLPLDKAWLLDAQGRRVSSLDTEAGVLDSVQWTGFIIGRRFLPMEGMSYELELLLTGDALVRWRAPSGEVQSTDSVNNRLILGTTSQFGDTISDPNRFDVGDDIILYNPDGTVWDSTVYEITVRGVDYIDLDAYPGSDPPAGTIVELAYLDSDDSGTGYKNDGLDGTFTNIDRAYVFMADDSNTLGDADDESDKIG